MDDLNHAGSRRLITFVDADGKSRFAPDDSAPRLTEFEATPQMRLSVLWSTNPELSLPSAPPDPVPYLETLHPTPGGSTFLIMTLPPQHVFASPTFDLAASVAEQLLHCPGIAERMEADAPGFHATSTVDYVVLLAGEIWLVLDADERKLIAGDSVIQLGARHAWQNRSDKPATLAVVLMGASDQRSEQREV